MFQGKVSAALRWIGSQSTSVVPADEDVMNELRRLHPSGEQATDSCILKGPIDKVETVSFDGINADLIQQCAKKTEGSAGPSGLDADGWKRILCSKQFKSKPFELCEVIADLARKLCTSHVNPAFLKAYCACRLVPLSKSVNSVRPVGIGEILRRIIGKALMQHMKVEVVNTTAPIQCCSGLAGGAEAAIHALRRLYEDHDTEAIMLVDADNAFNRMNRNVALNNIQYTCPEIATYLINTYRESASLFVAGNEEPLSSEEGVTQGDNSAMGYYACSLMPLQRTLMLKQDDQVYEKLKQQWYADDAASGGKLKDISEWWKRLCKSGPLYGYHPKPSKSCIIVKTEYYETAKQLFPDVPITDVGSKYLGSYIGTEEGKLIFMDKKIKEWINDVDEISEIATREPQVAYAAYVYGLSKRWNYICRTTPGISVPLKKLEYKIRETFIPAILDRTFSCTDTCRRLFALPARDGGLSIFDISDTSDAEYSYSSKATSALSNAIYNQDQEFNEDGDAQYKIKSEITQEKLSFHKRKREELWEELTDLQRLQLDLASEKGASSWLTSLPLKSLGYILNKQEFNDAVALRYNLKIKDTAKLCVCGEMNTLNHNLICKLGGYVSLRHNTLRDTTAELLRYTCRDVVTEPPLLPIAGVHLPRGSITTDNARLDVSVRSLWNPLERAFMDIRVFHAPATSNRNLKSIPKMYIHHEELKKKAYNARVIQVEKGVFTPMVFSTTGGMGEEAKKMVKRLAEKYAMKSGQSYAESVSFIRRRLRFDLLKTTIIALRGYRGKPRMETQDVSELDLNISPDV